MALLRVGALPDEALAAAAQFHAEVLPGALAFFSPPPLGEVASRSDNGGGPLRPFGTPPPRREDFLTLIFPPADHSHRAWRLAAVQSLGREYAPIRVNALASDSEAAIAAALSFLASAEGVTGQLLELDDTGAGEVVSLPA